MIGFPVVEVVAEAEAAAAAGAAFTVVVATLSQADLSCKTFSMRS